MYNIRHKPIKGATTSIHLYRGEKHVHSFENLEQVAAYINGSPQMITDILTDLVSRLDAGIKRDFLSEV